MPSKKKSKLLFEVPTEVESGIDSGWVYRSERDSAAEPGAGTSPGVVDTSVGAMSATTLALAIAAMAQAVVLGITIAMVPWTFGLRAFQSLNSKPH